MRPVGLGEEREVFVLVGRGGSPPLKMLAFLKIQNPDSRTCWLNRIKDNQNLIIETFVSLLSFLLKK